MKTYFEHMLTEQIKTVLNISRLNFITRYLKILKTYFSDDFSYFAFETTHLTKNIIYCLIFKHVFFSLRSCSRLISKA